MGLSSSLDPKRWQALAVLGIAYLMVVLDVSIVNVALPSIQRRSPSRVSRARVEVSTPVDLRETVA